MASLSALRQDLSLHPGPPASDGSPTWTLHDPAANRFYQLSWPAFEVLSRWSLGDPERIVAAVNRETTLTISSAEIDGVLQFLTGHHLLLAATPEDSERLAGAQQATRLSKPKWLLKNYLFFRLPLVRPMPILARVAPLMGWVYHRYFWFAIVMVALLGLYLASRRWDEFTHTFAAYAGLQGLLGIGVALTFAKVLHELGHALTAYRYGCRVPTMGVAFLVMWPVLYTDTNEAWKLTERSKRLKIGAAGILAELALAACATLLWNFMSDGPLRAGVFLLATSTWLITLAINASPFMRFDGYFLLADWLNMPNLHERSFAMGRWWLRERLFGFGDPEPEIFPPKRRRFLIAFAWATWLYRLVLFLGIALMVYHLFFKALGLLLMVVELAWFIALPVQREVRVWWQRRGDLRWGRQTGRTALLLVMLAALVLVPWQGAIHAPALLTASQTQGLYAIQGARIVGVAVAEAQEVHAGEVLVQLESPELRQQLAAAEARERQARWQLERQPFDMRLQDAGATLTKRWEAAQEEVTGLRGQIEQLTVVAPFDGVVAQANPYLATGSWVAQGEQLFYLVGGSGRKGEGFIGEAELDAIQIGQRARFIADLPEQPPLDCRVAAADQVNLGTLEQPYVASVHGGPIPVQRGAREELIPTRSTFRVRLDDCGAGAIDRELPGTVVLKGERRSLAARGATWTLATLQREAGL